MARSHHRKKHKEHLRQYQHSHEAATSTPKGKSVTVFIIMGAIIGLAISYFSSDRSVAWSIVGTLAGGTGGYFFGRNIDRQGRQ